MKFFGLALPLLFVFLTSCGGGSSPTDDTPSNQDDAPMTPEQTPEQTGVLGDSNGNGVADGFEVSVTGGEDSDGDLLDDRVDVDFQFGFDNNNNGISDRFEADPDDRDDIDNNGVRDFAYPAPSSSGRPAISLPPVGGDSLLTMDFEDGTPESNEHNVEVTYPEADDAITVSDAVARSGNRSLRTLVRTNDNYITFGRHRAESATVRNGLDRLGFGSGETWVYEFSIYFDESWPIDSKRSDDIVFQWKSWEIDWPSMLVVIEGAELNLRITDISRLNSNTGPDHQRVNLLQFYRAGEWIDLRFEVRFADVEDAGNGYIKSFVKYAADESYSEVGTHTGRNLLQSGPCCSYLKWGIYKPVGENTVHSSDSERIVFHDDIRIYKVD